MTQACEQRHQDERPREHAGDAPHEAVKVWRMPAVDGDERLLVDGVEIFNHI
jgi:hypothetical protein